ncbi:MAG: hypothetical protein ACHQ16_02705 [Candidatus Lutacidiplasmatales archaeon]
MSLSVDVPDELGDFLLRPGPASLLIRGESGTGKSLLSLSLLNLFNGRRTLLTARAADPDVMARHSGATSRYGTVEVIAPDRTDAPVASGSSSADSSAQGDSFPSVAYPRFFELALKALGAAPPALVVFDSWEALASDPEGVPNGGSGRVPTRVDLERKLFSAWVKSSAHLVLVSTESDRSQLDYLADATCALELTELDERPLRLLRFSKLRGRSGRSMEYPFTVSEGHFRCFAIAPHGYPLQSRRTDPDPEPNSSTMWPGSQEFATVFGRLPPGGLTLIEADRAVPLDVVRMLTVPMIASALTSHAVVIIAPPPSLTPEELWKPFSDSISPEAFAEQVFAVVTSGPKDTGPRWTDAIHPSELPGPTGFRFVPPRELSTSGGAPRAGPEEFAAQLPDLEAFLSRSRQNHTRSLSIGYAEGNLAIGRATGFPMDPESYASTLRAYLVGEGAHGVAIGRPAEPLFDTIRSYAGLHLNLRAYKGRYIIYATRPWSPSYILAIAEDEAPGMGPYHLVPLT